MSFQKIRLIGIVLAVAIILLIPYVAMKVTGEVKWSAIDFITAGALLLGTGLACEFVLRVVRRTAYRVAICAGLLVVLLIIWAELAVGLIGTRFAGS